MLDVLALLEQEACDSLIILCAIGNSRCGRVEIVICPLLVLQLTFRFGPHSALFVVQRLPICLDLCRSKSCPTAENFHACDLISASFDCKQDLSRIGLRDCGI